MGNIREGFYRYAIDERSRRIIEVAYHEGVCVWRLHIGGGVSRWFPFSFGPKFAAKLEGPFATPEQAQAFEGEP
jgi:hypothetical protein